jgi:mannitol/fructose-specific phosphotransferase system IIA component (Ntr-type)
MVVAIFVSVEIIVKAASSVLILTYLFACLANIILRESRLQNYQPAFRAPLYPWVQLFGIAGFVFLLVQIGVEALLMSLILIITGLFVYWFYGRIRATREFALLHLIERITAKELTTHSLETELKEIICERDEIVKDRFDHLIEDCPVLDCDEAMTADVFFRRAADTMASRLHVSSEELNQLFLTREKESTTVLNPDLAIPHIVIDGEHEFDILLARSKRGIYFSETAPAVHTVFLLVGTKDERPFHLRALAAIAQIVQDPHFEEKWERAKSVEALRDLVLLGKRRRHH